RPALLDVRERAPERARRAGPALRGERRTRASGSGRGLGRKARWAERWGAGDIVFLFLFPNSFQTLTIQNSFKNSKLDFDPKIKVAQNNFLYNFHIRHFF
ncbi:hypothetical protein, partial [Haemophilus sp. SZY H53]